MKQKNTEAEQKKSDSRSTPSDDMDCIWDLIIAVTDAAVEQLNEEDDVKGEESE